MDPKTGPSTQTPSAVLDILKGQLECPICGGIFHEPLSLLPCLHSFCGCCASQWVSKNPTCPSCRTRVTDTMPDFKAKQLALVYLGERPEEKRDEEEIKELDAVYKAGTKLNLRSRVYDDYDEEDEDYDMEEDQEEPRFEPAYWEACPWCLPPTAHSNYNPQFDANRPPGFVCINPLPPPGFSTIPRVRVNTVLQIPDVVASAHSVCSHCNIVFPNSAITRQHCRVCNKTVCGNVFGNCPVSHHMAPMDFQWAAIFRQTLGPGEAEVLQNYVSENNTTIAALFAAWASENSNSITHPPHQPLTRDIVDLIRDNAEACLHCRNEIFTANLADWWKATKATRNVWDDRPKCWYGWNCRTMHHNHEHRERLNHMCPETPADQRRDTGSRSRRNRGTSGRGGGAVPPDDNDDTAGNDVSW